MERWDVINYFIKRFEYKSYLEIGVDRGECFEKVMCERRVGVDPAANTTCRMTSDKFFQKNEDSFDIIFIDGLHERNQVLRDIENSLEDLNENGTILVHDTYPKSEERLDPELQGNVWEAIVWIKYTRPDLTVRTLFMDTGITVIRRLCYRDLEMSSLYLNPYTFEGLKEML